MRKILYITTVSRTVNAFLVPHIHMLLDKGVQVDCACCIDKEIDSSLIERGVKVFDIPFSRNPLSSNNFNAYKMLKEIQRKNQYDWIHVHTPIAGLYGRLLKVSFPHLKAVYTAHGFHFHQGGSKVGWLVYYPIERLMASFTDILITINEEDFKRASNFKAKKIFKINGVGINPQEYNISNFNRDEVKKQYGLDKDDFVIAMIAEVNVNKNHKQMLEAVKILNEQGIHVKVLCAGEGTLLNEIKDEIKVQGLNQQVKMLGFSQNIKEIIVASDIGLLLSYREGLPRSVMELMCFKKPVIGTNIRGNRDLISHGENGYLVEIGDYQQTADYIKQLFLKKELVKNLGEKAAKSMDSFSIDKVLNQLDEIIIQEDWYGTEIKG